MCFLSILPNALNPLKTKKNPLNAPPYLTPSRKCVKSGRIFDAF